MYRGLGKSRSPEARGSGGAPQPAESTADASQPAESTADVEADGDGAPRGAPDGDVISKAIEGKELDEEEQRRLRIMFQEMERSDRPWPTTGEHCFRITMAGLTRGGATQPADNRIAVAGSRSRSRSPPPVLALALTLSQFTAAYRAYKIAIGAEPPATPPGSPPDDGEVYPLPSSDDLGRTPPAPPRPQPPDP
jgi:hypothetical protein